MHSTAGTKSIGAVILLAVLLLPLSTVVNATPVAQSYHHTFAYNTNMYQYTFPHAWKNFTMTITYAITLADLTASSQYQAGVIMNNAANSGYSAFLNQTGTSPPTYARLWFMPPGQIYNQVPIDSEAGTPYITYQTIEWDGTSLTAAINGAAPYQTTTPGTAFNMTKIIVSSNIYQCTAGGQFTVDIDGFYDTATPPPSGGGTGTFDLSAVAPLMGWMIVFGSIGLLGNVLKKYVVNRQ